MNDKPIIKHICFDLDGTLINSYQTIYKTTLKTLKFLNIPDPLHENEFYKRIGHHFLNIFDDLKIPVTDIEHFINIYKSFYFEFIDDSVLYEGAIEILEMLLTKDISISLLTTKSQDQSDKIINHFGLRKYFSFIMGRRNGVPIKPSAEPLLFICKEINIHPNQTLIVGDSELDIKCGKNAGSFTCAVTYGYRTKEILLMEKPDYFISNLMELKNLIIKKPAKNVTGFYLAFS